MGRKVTVPGSEKEILVVEDSRVQAERLKGILPREGYGVRIAREGLEGPYMIAESRPNLIQTISKRGWKLIAR
jgi:PleD family two-component response regulator